MQLKLFLLLAEELHFGRAARRAFISQPAFSRHISALEGNLGVQLINRTTHTVALTPAGQALTDQIRLIVDTTDELRRQAERAAGAGTGRLVIGSLAAITSVDPVPAILEEVRRRLPGVRIQIWGAGFDVATVLLEGLVDAAFLFLPVPDGVQHLELEPGPRCAAMSTGDPLAQRDGLTVSDLSDRPHIGWSDRVPKVFRDFWACDPRPNGDPVHYSRHAVSDLESALALIAMGEGIQLPPDLARVLYPRAGVSYVPVEDLPPGTTALAWPTAKRDHPSVIALRRATRAVVSVRNGDA
ncbi:lysR family transcriptional regulatory protein [Streptomyces sp. NL15-2K]|nr:lysR family transcriptional regulatory protein [Streptomyces sp. NL15-2K]